jgi:hypothetical protein
VPSRHSFPAIWAEDILGQVSQVLLESNYHTWALGYIRITRGKHHALGIFYMSGMATTRFFLSSNEHMLYQHGHEVGESLQHGLGTKVFSETPNS